MQSIMAEVLSVLWYTMLGFGLVFGPGALFVWLALRLHEARKARDYYWEQWAEAESELFQARYGHLGIIPKKKGKWDDRFTGNE